MSFKTKEDYLKEIADEINKGKEIYIENPTVEDIEKIEGHNYIITDGAYFPVIIRKRYILDTVLKVPVLFETDGYEIGDNVMGMIPETLTAEDCLEELQGFKGEDDIL